MREWPRVDVEIRVESETMEGLGKKARIRGETSHISA